MPLMLITRLRHCRFEALIFGFSRHVLPPLMLHTPPRHATLFR